MDLNFYGWRIKEWNLNDRSSMEEWIQKWEHKYQMREIFINNKLAIEYRVLIQK